jgi:Icc-related predicted phosphoesterase
MTTRIQLFSDLHADWRTPKPIEIGDGVDVVVVPGDVGEGAHNSFVALRRIVPLDVPIVFTMGNHEYYRRFYFEELDEARSAAPDFNVALLECDTAVVAKTRFVGATAWTDYRLFGDARLPAAMAAARDEMNDHRRIGWRKKPWGRFRPQEAATLHIESRNFIRKTIADPYPDGPTIVVTHTAPSIRSVPERWKNQILTAAYASSIGDDLLACPPDESGPPAPRVDCWFHGHVHARADYRIGATRVVCNPHGYGDEVTGFDPCLVIEIES